MMAELLRNSKNAYFSSTLHINEYCQSNTCANALAMSVEDKKKLDVTRRNQQNQSDSPALIMSCEQRQQRVK